MDSTTASLPRRTFSQVISSSSHLARSSSRAVGNSLRPISVVIDNAMASLTQGSSNSQAQEPERLYIDDPVNDPLGAWRAPPVAIFPLYIPTTARPSTPEIPQTFRERTKERLSEFFTLPVGSVEELVPPIWYYPDEEKMSRPRKLLNKWLKAVKKAKEVMEEAKEGVKKRVRKD